MTNVIKQGDKTLTLDENLALTIDANSRRLEFIIMKTSLKGLSIATLDGPLQSKKFTMEYNGHSTYFQYYKIGSDGKIAQ